MVTIRYQGIDYDEGYMKLLSNIKGEFSRERINNEIFRKRIANSFRLISLIKFNFYEKK